MIFNTRSLRCNLSSGNYNKKKRYLSENNKKYFKSQRNSKSNLLNTLNNDNNINLINENLIQRTTPNKDIYIKREAKEIINKTRKMMEDLSLNKVNNDNNENSDFNNNNYNEDDEDYNNSNNNNFEENFKKF